MDGPKRTVLIVDDEPQILNLVQKMLGPQNISLLAAPKPSAALEICAQHSIDLLISDMRMPEMDGARLAERVLKLYPAVRVLLISGHFKEPPTIARTGQIRFLKKPFFPSDLLKQLREMLAECEDAAASTS